MKSGKPDSFRHILKSSPSTYESSGSQFFRITSEIQWFVMTFLTILEVTEILCSLRLVLEGQTGQEVPES